MNHFSFFSVLKTLLLSILFVFLCSFSYGNYLQADSTSKPQTVTFPKFRLAAQIGYANRFEPPQIHYDSPAERKYNSKLASSLCYGIDLTHYFFGKYIGIGLKFNGIYSQAKQPKVQYWPDGDMGILPISEKIGIYFIGSYFSGRYFIKPNKVCLFMNAGAGFAICRHKTTLMHFGETNIYMQNKLSINTTAAFSAEIGYDFFVTKSLAVGILISSSVGLLRERVDVDYLGVTLGLRYWK